MPSQRLSPPPLRSTRGKTASRGNLGRSKPAQAQSTDRPGSSKPRSSNYRASLSGRNAGRGRGRGKPIPPTQHVAASTSDSFHPTQPPPSSPGTMGSPAMTRDWRTWAELTVGLHDVPPGTETGDLYEAFSGYGGKIDYMEILDNTRGRGITARVRFSPIPSKSFWETGTVSLSPKNGTPQRVPICIEGPRRLHNGVVQSPVTPRTKYPAVTKLRPSSMNFGVMADEKTMLVMKKMKSLLASNEEDEKVGLNVDLIRRKIDVTFGMVIGKNIESYKFHLEFSTLKKVYWHHVGDRNYALIIPTDYPSAYFWKRGDLEETFSTNRLSWSSRDLWCRVTDIVSDTKALYEHPISLPNEPADLNFVNLGRWTTFGFILERCEETDVVLRALGDFNIQAEAPDDFRVEPFKGPSFWSILESRNKGTTDPHIKAISLLANVSGAHEKSLAFEVRYQLEVCISHGIFSEYRLGPEFLQKLVALDSDTAKHLLEHVADTGKANIDPMSIFDNGNSPASVSIKYKPVVYNDRVLTRKVLVTPTAMYLTSPTPELANRILRKHRDIQDHFLRVQFTGEFLEGRINSRANTDRDDEVYKRVYRVLDRGIRIGDRHFEFLAFGNSQMRENGAYFFAPTDHISCDDIRKSMGSLGHIRSVAKYAARMGQGFSTTREVRTVNVPVVQSIPDIENQQGYCFTDGVGKISKFLAHMAANEMGLGFQIRPSAYQFRMGGCKGVLAVWPDAKKSEVHIRMSQEKFVSQYKGLEVIRCAQFATATLNRQTITILSSLGVPNDAFIDLLDKHLDAHTKAELNSHDAIALLRQHVDENQTTLTLAKILLHGFKEPDVQEPFVISILHLWKIWSLKLIKEKARIPVEKSAFVLGCADETGTLRGHSKATEGSKVKDVSKLPQIFLQVSDAEEPQKSTVITGVCIVGRNPSLHPGDIRVVEAVDVPALRHLRDVVVFPTKGDRDVPSMLSGGDLDGDDFFVIWDPTLLPPEWNHPPMEHLPVKPKVLNRDVQTRDLRAFFVKYMKNDILPTVAIAHLALADYFDEGAKNEKCLALAQLHSKAVDYVKSGEPAEMEKSLRPRRWPTFMEKRVPNEMQYRSHKPLGIIYDKVHSVGFAFNPTYTSSFDKRILDKCVKDKELLKKATQIKTQYDTALRRIMGQREIKTEFEIWSGFVLSRPRVGSGYKLQEEIGREYGGIKMKFREICQQEAGGSSAPHIDAFVAAMYKVTEEEVNIALHLRSGPVNSAGRTIEPKSMDPKSMPLISFPWIFHEVLCRLATGTKSPEVPQETMSQEGTNTSREASGAEMNGNQATTLNDGRIVHRGEVLNLFGSTEGEDELVNLAQNGATTQAENDVQEGNFKQEAQSDAGSDVPKRLPQWLKTKLRQKAPGEPDARTLIMSQIERDLADMSAGKQVGTVRKGCSVVSAPEIRGDNDVISSKGALSRVSDAKKLENGVGGEVSATGMEDLLDLSNGSSDAKMNEGIGDMLESGDEGRHRVGVVEESPTLSTRGNPNGEVPMGVKGRGPGMKHEKQGHEQAKENRPNLSASEGPKRTAGMTAADISSCGGSKSVPAKEKQEKMGHPSSGGAVEKKVQGALAAANLLQEGVHQAGERANTSEDSKAKAAAGVAGMAAPRKPHHGKAQKPSAEKVVEAKESSAVDLLLDL